MFSIYVVWSKPGVKRSLCYSQCSIAMPIQNSLWLLVYSRKSFSHCTWGSGFPSSFHLAIPPCRSQGSRSRGELWSGGFLDRYFSVKITKHHNLTVDHLRQIDRYLTSLEILHSLGIQQRYFQPFYPEYGKKSLAFKLPIKLRKNYMDK